MKKAKQTKTYIGGQAVIEGVMMKSPWRTALAVRTGEGEISVEDVEYTSAGDRHRWMKKPFIRGVVNLVEMMVLGTKLITRSAELAFPEDAENAPPKAQKTVGTGQLEQKGDAKESEGECAADETSTALDAGTIGSSRMLLLQSREEAERPGQNKSADMPKEEKSSMQVAATIGAVLGIGLALCLFVVLPSLIVSWIAPAGSNMNPTVLNIIEGGVRLGIFLAYLLLVTLMPDIRRVFM